MARSVDSVAGPVLVASFVGVFATFLTHQWWSNGKEKEDSQSLLGLIQRRRSIFPKQYSSKPVPRKILDEMLEAARWAPTHKLTEPWEFVVFESPEGRQELGQFLANQYKESSGANFVQSKYDKKISNAKKSSFVVALLCNDAEKKNPLVEEICSVAMAVQNMLLVATAHNIGAYWSTGCVHDKQTQRETNNKTLVWNPASTREFLNLGDGQICLGWMFVGDFYGDEQNGKVKKWPEGRRKDLGLERLSWR